MNDELAEDVVNDGYWMRAPRPDCDVVIAYHGVVASEAIAVAGMIGNDRREIGEAAQQARSRGDRSATSQAERLLTGLRRRATIVTVIDGHPATLGWLGGVFGHPTVSLGVEHFGQTGRVSELYRHFGVDAASIVATVEGVTSGSPVRLAPA